ncbi:MAG: Ig-like domain-containing domain [Chitinophagaceae bacterium]
MKKPILIRIFIPFLLVVFLLSQLLFQTGCANIVPPEGGLRDTLPPVLVRSTPPNNSRNFNEDRITFSFDEYVDLDNYQQNVIVSPLPVNMPTMTRKLNTITIKIRDSIEENTTYSFNFGNSIKDINEGNVMKDFTYTYSTGSYIDSLEFSGRVLLAETGAPDSTMTVMLYRDKEDSAVINKRPRFITKVNGSGNFTFRNLSPGTFYLYALKDEGSYRYLSPKQLFAFADAPVQVDGSKNDSLVLYAYSADVPATTTPPASRSNKPADKRLKFQTNINAGKQDLLGKFIINFETPLRNFDSSKIILSSDTTYTPVTGYRWTLDTTRKILVLNNEWKENTLYNIVLQKEFATDTLSQQLLKTDTLNFTTRARNEYGNILIRFRNLDLSKNPVLQFVQGDQLKFSFPLTATTFTQSLIEPGDYSLRILNDNNKNGKWDPGVFFNKHQQPEIVKPVSRKVTTVRPNWDNQFEIVL